MSDVHNGSSFSPESSVGINSVCLVIRSNILYVFLFVFPSANQRKGLPEAQEQSGLLKSVLLTLLLMMPPRFSLLNNSKAFYFPGLKLSSKVVYFRIKERNLYFFIHKMNGMVWFVCHTMVLLTK